MTGFCITDLGISTDFWGPLGRIVKTRADKAHIDQD